MLTYCEEVSETLGLLLYNKNGVAKRSETLRLLLYNKNGVAKGSETLRLVFHEKDMELQKEAKHFA